MNVFKINNIRKSNFLKLNEDDLMFITNPGRMGDEDGLTFIIKSDNSFTIYRIDGLMYRKENEKEDISLKDIKKKFPKWHDTWKHHLDKNYQGKYHYLYMGFGNGLCIDNSIYQEFELYLNKLITEYLKSIEKSDKDNYQYAAIFNTWKEAFINWSNDNNYIIK